MKHENTFQPLLLQHIRRYAALDASSPSNGPRKLFMRGIEAVQRNTMPLTVRLMTSTLRLLLSRTDTMEAKDHVRKAVADLMADTQVRQSPHLRRRKGEVWTGWLAWERRILHFSSPSRFFLVELRLSLVLD